MSGECATENKDVYFCVTALSVVNMSFDPFVQVCSGGDNTHNVDIKKGLSMTM